MSLWLKHLLDDPALGLELVAGQAGLAGRGPVRWAHSSELPEPGRWLEGGEILLTTGLGVKDSPELQRGLIASLDDRGCAGVGFGLGVWVDRVPPALLAEADARRMPLFTVPYEVPFIAVTKQVADAVAAERYALLRGAVDLHRRVLAEVVGGSGLDEVLRPVADRLPDHAVVAFDYYGQVLACRDPGGRRERVDTAALWRAVAPHRQPHARFEAPAGGAAVVTGAVVRLGDEVEAVLCALGERALWDDEALLFEQALAGLSLELARHLSVREARRALVDEVLDEVLAGGPVASRRLARLGFDPSAGFHVLCLERPAAVGERALCALAEDVLGAEAQPIVGRAGGRVYCIVQPATSAVAEGMAAAVRGRCWRDVRIGRSRVRRHADGLAGAVREARAALAAPAPDGGVRDVTALGLPGLLAGVDDVAAPAAFVASVLGPVLEHDARESSALVASLRAYLHAGCRPGPAAEELHVHRHTLAYRLDRIRDLTGRDPRDGTHLTEFGVALELLSQGIGV